MCKYRKLGKSAWSIALAAMLMCNTVLFSGCNKSKSSIPTSVSTDQIEPITTTVGPLPLNTPTNLTITTNESSNITLTWGAVENASGYAVYRSQYAEDYKAFDGYELLGVTTETTYCDTDSNVTTNINWYYTVQALTDTSLASFVAKEYVPQYVLDTPSTDNWNGNSSLAPAIATTVNTTLTRQPAENLTDRAVIGVDLAGDKGAEIYKGATDIYGNEYTEGVYLSWRAFDEDPIDVTFDVYRNNELIADDITVTNIIDEAGKYGDTYKVIGSSDAELGLNSIETAVWENYYIDFELNRPEYMQLPLKKDCLFYSNDLSVADLDNDGQYELIVKWMPDNQQDNTGGVPTGYTFIDAYDVDFTTGEATQMWRINLGPNIRSGAHYCQYLVWDMDGDGIAEIACKTADASTTFKCVDGELVETGHVGECSVSDILTNKYGKSDYDYRGATGMILAGPEYLTIFKGDTGEIIDTVEYTPGRGDIYEWGDGGGNRCDRFLACVAYLDGENPYMVFTRGYYAKTALSAYRLNGGKLELAWTFNSDSILEEYYAEFELIYDEDMMLEYKEKYSLDFTDKTDEEIKADVFRNYKGEVQSLCTGQGNHNLSVADVDNDGKDEIIFGSMAVDNNGELLYSTGLGHGDALHVSDFVESNPGLEVFQVHENAAVKYIVDMRDAETGETIYGAWVGKDNGRGLTADIDPRYVGSEFWSAADKYVHSSEATTGNDILVAETRPSINFDILWDGDLLSEMQDHHFVSDGYYPVATTITDWDYEKGVPVEIFNSKSILTNNGSKGNLGLVADIFGDWREEIVSRHSENHNVIRIYMSVIPTNYVIPCLMEDDNYRLGVAWQNVGYNQPTHTSYLMSAGLRTSEVTATATEGKIEVTFTDACDGVLGHEIEGYELYMDEGFGSYIKLADIAVGVNSYTLTTGISAGKTYSFKVAAVVDGTTSYFSFPASVTAK